MKFRIRKAIFTFKNIPVIIFEICFFPPSEPPPPAASRSLIMIAKCLQNLANLVEFGAKESYMEVVNPFILKNKERMVVFLDHLSVSNFFQKLYINLSHLLAIFLNTKNVRALES